MPKSPSEPTNLVLEQLRVMRAETNARFDNVERGFKVRLEKLADDIADIKKDIRGLKINTIAEIYKPT